MTDESATSPGHPLMSAYADERRKRGRAIFDELRRGGLLAREPSDAELDYFGDGAAYGDIQALQELRWIRSAQHYASLVAERRSTDADESVFWIRFMGILLDIAPRQRQSIERARKFLGDAMLAASPVHRLVCAFVGATEKLASAVPSDELLYAEYRRHVECHPRQTHYRARLMKDGTLAEVSSKALDDSRAQDEMEDIIRRVLLRHGLNETNIAIAVAKRVIEPLIAVEAASAKLNEPLK